MVLRVLQQPFVSRCQPSGQYRGEDVMPGTLVRFLASVFFSIQHHEHAVTTLPLSFLKNISCCQGKFPDYNYLDIKVNGFWPRLPSEETLGCLDEVIAFWTSFFYRWKICFGKVKT